MREKLLTLNKSERVPNFNYKSMLINMYLWDWVKYADRDLGLMTVASKRALID